MSDFLARLNLKKELGNSRLLFFVIGQNIETHPETVQKLIDSGHEVGNHSYSHQKLIWKTPAFVRSEIEKTDELLRQLGIEQEILFRAPFGYCPADFRHSSARSDYFNA